MTKYDLTEKDKVWLACAIDGEGSVVSPPSQAIACYNSSIEFINNVRRILDELKVIYDFSTSYYTNSSRKPVAVTKSMYQVRCWRREEVLKIAPVILPYLLIPKKIKAAERILIECKKSLDEEEKRFQEYITILRIIEIKEQTAKEISSSFRIYDKVDFLQKKGYLEKVCTGTKDVILKRTSKAINRDDFRRHKGGSN